jgi:hypothetical protein
VAVAADVPNKFDVVINGEGYMFAEPEDVKATYGYTPTFAQRLSLQGDYGDNQQDFWLTWTQRDWSLGEGQKYFRADDDRARRYWLGNACDVTTIQGQVSLAKAKKDVTFAQNITQLVARRASDDTAIAIGSSNAYEMDAGGTITSLGAHGTTPLDELGIAADGTGAVYFSADQGATDGVRKISSADAFSNFNTDARIAALEYMNNTLYGVISGTGLVRYDTAGVKSTIFSWKGADGTVQSGKDVTRLRAHGSKLAILRVQEPLSSLWFYDGASGAPTMAAEFPGNFAPFDMASAIGVLFISGVVTRIKTYAGSPTYQQRPTIMYYANGFLGVLWQANDYTLGADVSVSWAPGTAPAIATWGNGLAFITEQTHAGATTSGRLMYYEMSTGGISTLAEFGVLTRKTLVSFGGVLLWASNGATSGGHYPDVFTTATTGSLTSSLIDFDSSLDKIFRGIKVEFDSASDGNGGTVDIAYRVANLDGSYTTLQTTAVSGTEYALTNITGRAISVKVTLNKGTSTAGPVLKRVSVRAIPQQLTGSGTVFRKDAFVIQCTGRDGKSPLVLRDETLHPKDGLQMAQELRTAASSTNPISVTDEFGTFTAVVENEGFQLRRVRPNEFIAVVPVREV